MRYAVERLSIRKTGLKARNFNNNVKFPLFKGAL